MNVMLNIPVEAGADRAGTSPRRPGDATGDAGDFRTLFDQVGQARSADPNAQTGVASATAETPDNGETDGAPRGASERDAGKGSARDVTQPEPGEEAGSDRPDRTRAAVSRGEDGVIHSPRRDMDGTIVRADRQPSPQTGRGDTSKATPAEPRTDAPSATTSAITPADAQADRLRHTDKDVASDPVIRGQSRPERKDDDAATLADERAAMPMGAAAPPPVVVAKANSDAGAGRAVALNAGQARRADEREAPPGARQQENSTVVSATSPKPAAVNAQSDLGQARGSVRSNSVVAFAQPADGDSKVQSDGSPDASQADRWTPPSRGADQPVTMRVTGYERHLAPLASPVVPGGTPAAAAATGEGGSAGNATPPVASESAGNGVRQVAAGMMETPRALRKGHDGQTDPSEHRGESPATAKAPAERRIAAENDPISAPDSIRRSGYDRPQGQQDRMMGPSASAQPTQLGEKRQVAVGPANTGSPATAATASAAATAVPLTAGVASAVVGALAATPAAAPLAAPQRLDGTGTVAAAEPVRTITLNLDMQEHGQVDLRISLKGNVINLHVKADRAETADALARDDATLRAVLHRAGYEAQQVQIDKRDGTQARLGDAASSGQQQPAGGAGSGASSGHAAGDQRAPQPQQRSQPQRDAFVLPDQDTHDAPRQDRYRGPDRLYV